MQYNPKNVDWFGRDRKLLSMTSQTATDKQDSSFPSDMPVSYNTSCSTSPVIPSGL